MTTLMTILGICMIGLGISLMGIGKPKTKKPKKYDWSLKAFLNDPPRDIAHSPSKRYRRN